MQNEIPLNIFLKISQARNFLENRSEVPVLFCAQGRRGGGVSIQYVPHGDSNEPKIIQEQDFGLNLRGRLDILPAVVSTGM